MNTTQPRAIELSLSWGDTLLETTHVFGRNQVIVGGHAAADLWVDGAVPQEVIIEPGDERVLRFGALEARLRWIACDTPVRTGLQPIDGALTRSLGLSALAHGFFAVAATMQPIAPEDLGREALLKARPQIQSTLFQEKKELDSPVPAKGPEGARSKGDEGLYGRKAEKPNDAKPSKRGARRVDPDARERDREAAMRAGLLSALTSASKDSAVSQILGGGGFGSGENIGLGGLKGLRLGDASGMGGLSTRGRGAGGGGDAVGIGGLSPNGRGHGPGGGGDINLGQSGSLKRTRIIPGKRIVKGSLKPSEIERVIQRNRDRIKYCYERELNAHPDLRGKVSVRFTIISSGSVAKTVLQDVTIPSQAVASCVQNVISSLRFPPPKGGGIVEVTYPFLFTAR